MFATQEFKDWAAGRVVLLSLDFPLPRSGKEPTADAAALEERHGVHRFPTILLLDAELERLGEVPVGTTRMWAWLDDADKALRAAREKLGG